MFWSCISTLPYKMQCVIILKHISDLSQEDTPGVLNIPVGTVKSRLYHGLHRLSLQLTESEESEGFIKEVVPHD